MGGWVGGWVGGRARARVCVCEFDCVRVIVCTCFCEQRMSFVVLAVVASVVARCALVLADAIQRS